MLDWFRTGLDCLAEKKREAERRKPWHERTLRMGDRVTVLGRGIGRVESISSGAIFHSVHIRLGNNDLYSFH